MVRRLRGGVERRATAQTGVSAQRLGKLVAHGLNEARALTKREGDVRGHVAVTMPGERQLDPAEVMVYLNVLDRFETPAYEQAWRFFRETADECPDYESFRVRCPLWSEPYSQIDRVLCTYETAAVLIRHGGLNEDLFFEQIPRVIDVWAAAAPWVDGLRKDYRAGLFRSVEWLAKRMEQWESRPDSTSW